MARQQQETPKPTAPPVPPEGPELLDVDGALKRLGGKRWIYARVLHQFISDCSHFVETMGHCLANQDRQGIARLTHKMKGATSQVGATALYTMTLELERAVARPSTDIAIENLIAFEKRIQQTVASINDFIVSQEMQTESVTQPSSQPGKRPPADLLESIRRLASEGRFSQIERRIDMLEREDRDTKPFCEGVREHIRKYDEAALIAYINRWP